MWTPLLLFSRKIQMVPAFIHMLFLSFLAFFKAKLFGSRNLAGRMIVFSFSTQSFSLSSNNLS